MTSGKHSGGEDNAQDMKPAIVNEGCNICEAHNAAIEQAAAMREEMQLHAEKYKLGMVAALCCYENRIRELKKGSDAKSP